MPLKMEKYTIKDFTQGDKVYLLDNPKQVMVVMEIESTSKRIVCRWEKDGIANWKNFLPKDLEKIEK
jgi:hypothetical protein